jgi:capsular polysaccharide biosynthesis protein
VDLAQILRKLWHLKLFVALVAVVAAFAAVKSAYDVSLAPPGLESKAIQVGAATTELLVDSNQSPLAALNDQYVPLTERAAIYARFMSSPPVQKAIAEEVDLPAGVIATQSPDTVNPAASEAQGASGADPGAVQAPELGTGAPYQLTFLPRANIVSVYAQAPTPRQAERVANGAVHAFQKWIRDVQDEQNITAGARIELRQLGGARGGMITSGPDRKMAVLVFLGLLAGGCMLILAIANVVRNLRSAQAAELAGSGDLRVNGNGHLPELDLEPFSRELQPSGQAPGSRSSQEF